MNRRVALITGGARGIGAGVARSLGKHGFDLALSGRRTQEEVQPFLEDLREAGITVAYFQSDISSEPDRAALLEDIESKFGRHDVLVNNAGIAPKERTDILNATEESFEAMMDVNLRGPYFLTQGVARWMVRQQMVSKDPRAIITVSSVSAEIASVNRGDYCISKAGLSMASKLWAVRLAEYGISVYEVRPGIITTDMTQAVHEKYDKLIAEGLLLEGRWGTTEDVGRAVCTLACGEMPYATGAIINLDGGLTVPRL